jgi:hypothetical protein
VLIIWTGSAAHSQAPLPTVAEVEKQVLDHRRSIQRGELVFQSKTYTDGAPARERVTRIWFEADAMRCDVTLRYDPNEHPHREIYGRNCEKEGHDLNYSEQKFPGTTLALGLHKGDASGRGNASHMMLDPRLLGMAPDSSPNLVKCHLDSFVGRRERKPPTIRQASWKGIDCWLIEYTILQGRSVRIWIDPRRGPSVVRLEFEGISREQRPLVDSVESDLREYSPSGMWYPQSCVYERHIDGKLVEKEVVDVEVVSLNEPLDPEVFRLAGMRIPGHLPITGLDSPIGKELWWNGEEIVELYNYSRTGLIGKLKNLSNWITLRTTRSAGKRWLWLVISTVSAVVAVIVLSRHFFWRRRLRNRPRSGPGISHL